MLHEYVKPLRRWTLPGRAATSRRTCLPATLPTTCLPRGLARPRTAADSRDAESSVIQLVEEGPPADDEAQPAGPHRRPERVVGPYAVERLRDLLESGLRFHANFRRRGYQGRKDHDDAMVHAT